MRRPLLAAVAMLLAVPAAAQAVPVAPFGHAGRFFTDARGRVVVLHGVNMIGKHAPYRYEEIGFGEDDARFLRQEGFNTVRLGITWSALEPQRGVFDDDYLTSVMETANLLEREGIVPLIDFHQDMWAERFHGNGAPDWATIDDGLPNEPDAGFPGNYFGMPALWRSFDHFWANDDNLQTEYAAAWKHVAEAMRPDPFLLGFDIFNEPWPGSRWQECAQPAGCPTFDGGPLTEFSKRVFKSIREVDDRRLLFYEPNLLFDVGAEQHHGETGDDRAGMSFHNYCLGAAPGLPSAPQDTKDQGCPVGEQKVFDSATAQSEKTGDALLLTEMGATDEVADIARMVETADRERMSWQYWTYWNEQVPQSMILDAKKPPTPDNVKQDKVNVLVRPYPSATAGVPTWSYDPAKKSFAMTYTTGRADAKGKHPPGSISEISVPARVYPNGYNVAIDGGKIGSSPGSPIVTVKSLSGADKITVKIGPGTGQVLGVRRPALRLTVSPAKARKGRLTRFTFRAFSLSDGRRTPLRGVVIRFAGKRTVTGKRGSARIRARLRRARQVKAWKRGYAGGRLTVPVRRG